MHLVHIYMNIYNTAFMRTHPGFFGLSLNFTCWLFHTLGTMTFFCACANCNPELAYCQEATNSNQINIDRFTNSTLWMILPSRASNKLFHQPVNYKRITIVGIRFAYISWWYVGKHRASFQVVNNNLSFKVTMHIEFEYVSKPVYSYWWRARGINSFSHNRTDAKQGIYM